MSESTQFISQMLAPSIMISGTCFLISNACGHFSALCNRIGFLDSEMIKIIESALLDELHKKRVKIMESQMRNLILRGKLTKYSIFVLYIAMIFVIFSILAIAMEVANVRFYVDDLPIITFVIGVSFVFVAVILGIAEVIVALKAFDKDFTPSLKSLELMDKVDIDFDYDEYIKNSKEESSEREMQGV